MSVREDLAQWTADRVAEKVSAFNRVEVVGTPEEIPDLLLNPPGCGVVANRSVNSDTPTPPGEAYVYFYTEIYFSAQRFGTENAQGLVGQAGVYEIYDEIHAALKKQIPTDFDEYLEFQEGEITEVGDGVVLAYASYRTARQI